MLDESTNTCVYPEDCPCPPCDPLPANCSKIVTLSNQTCNCSVCRGIKLDIYILIFITSFQIVLLKVKLIKNVMTVLQHVKTLVQFVPVIAMLVAVVHVVKYLMKQIIVVLTLKIVQVM